MQAVSTPANCALSILTIAEDNLDAAAAEGAVGAVVPLLNSLSGGGAEAAMEQPSTRYVK